MSAARRSPLVTDLEEIVSGAPGLWDELRGARIFITGGTGFFGTWLVETLVQADRTFGLAAQAVILTRDKTRFLTKNPHLAGAAELSFHQGDIRSFDFPKGPFTYVIHAATEASVALNRERPELMRDVIVSGTRRVLDFSLQAGVKSLLFAGSGAVYGRQRHDVTHVDEDDPGAAAPLATADAYAEGKRAAERLCCEAVNAGLRTTIARGFAFIGPHLPLNTHFAIGNFIRDALNGGPIEVRGDGTPYRSYLYASDLAAWLWTILLKGESGRAYNVGSERRVSVAELARLVASELAPGARVKIAQEAFPGALPEQYVPSTARARSELALRETVDLATAVRRTAAWARSHPAAGTGLRDDS